MDSYIVRIYRRGIEPGREVAGLVERAGAGERTAFSDCEELWAFLCSKPRSAGRKSKLGRNGPDDGEP